MTGEDIIEITPRFSITDDIYVWNMAQGGNGTVLFCASPGARKGGMHIAFALKTPMPGLEFSGSALRRFRSECDTWLSNSHLQGVMPAEGLFELGSRIFLRMPVVLGTMASAANLRRYLEVHRIEAHLAVALATFASQGLTSIESSGRPVLHGDLKPENFLMYRGLPHLSDFGSSALQTVGSKEFRPGTVNYLPPEASESGVIDAVSGDVWSFGCILRDFEAAMVPSSDASPEYQRLEVEFRSLASKCLARDVSRRPPQLPRTERRTRSTFKRFS